MGLRLEKGLRLEMGEAHLDEEEMDEGLLGDQPLVLPRGNGEREIVSYMGENGDGSWNVSYMCHVAMGRGMSVTCLVKRYFLKRSLGRRSFMPSALARLPN